MASDTGSSIFALSTTQISTQSQSKPSRGPAPSIVWDHCRTANDGENPAIKYCKYCTDPAYSSSISFNMKNTSNPNMELLLKPLQDEFKQKLFNNCNNFISKRKHLIKLRRSILKFLKTILIRI